MVTPKTELHRKSRAPSRAFARALRQNPPDAERKFWSAVRGRQLSGFKFKRQYPVGPYIADFVCLERRMIIELDGGQHALQQDYDTARTAYLQAPGFRVLRFWNDEFLRNPQGTLDEIFRALTAPSPSAPR